MPHTRRSPSIPILLILLAIGVAIGFVVFAEKGSTLLIDRYVAGVEKNISSFREFELYIYGIFDVPIYVTGHDEQGNMKKLYATFNPDLASGEKTEDRIERTYYYDRGTLVYVYEVVNPNPGKNPDEESRLYFKDGQMIVWFFGPGKEKKPRDTVFARQEADVLDTSDDLLTASASRLAWIKRDPIPLATFLPGKSFSYTCEAGEQGIFKEDGAFPSAIPGEVNRGYDGGTWRLDGENIIISGSLLSDGVHSDFTFEEHDGKIIAYKDPACGDVIGPDFDTIERFLETRRYTFVE